MLSAGLISHNSIHLLSCSVAGVESGDQCLLKSDALSCFSGVRMSIRSFSLFPILSIFHSF